MPEPTLAQRIRAKYPGAYDDLTDAQLEAAVIAKYPGVYDDLPRTTTTSPPPSTEDAPQAPATFGSEFGQRVNPINLAKGLYQQAKSFGDFQQEHPIIAAAAPGIPIARDLVTGLIEEGKAGGKYLREGNYGAAAGVVLGAPAAVLEGMALGGAARWARGKVTGTPNLQTRNPKLQGAIDYADREGIPVSAGQRTDNRFVKGVEYVSDRTVGGSFAEEKAARARDVAVERQIAKEAGRAQRQPVSPRAAGELVESTSETRITDLDRMADVNYDTVRQIQADPRHLKKVPMQVAMTAADGSTVMQTMMVDVPLPIDLRPIKRAYRPIYEERLRATPEAVRGADPGLHAMKNLLDEPDFVPLMRAEADLGPLKRLTRKAISPQMRNTSQGLAARSIYGLEKQIRDVVNSLGDPRAKLALQSGRRLTAAKYAVQDLLDDIRGFKIRSSADRARINPVRDYERLTSGDASWVRVARLLKREPALRRPIARAVLDEIFDKGTETGTLTRADGMFRAWQNLGDELKKQLYTTAHITDLDHFFLLMKKLGENINPSGTGHVVTTLQQARGFFRLTAEGGLAWWNPIKMTLVEIGAYKLSKALHDPVTARKLVQGLNWTVRRGPSKRLAYATLAADLERAAASAGVPAAPVQMPAALPAAADEGEPDR